MAMRLLNEVDFHKELRKIGLESTGFKTDRTQLWQDKDKNPVMAPCNRDVYPDWMIDEVINALKASRHQGITIGENIYKIEE